MCCLKRKDFFEHYNNEEFLGVDQDSNSVRDDYQLYFLRRFDGVQTLVIPAFNIHKDLMSIAANLENNPLVLEKQQDILSHYKCILGTLEDIEYGGLILREIMAKTFDNKKRLGIYMNNSEKFKVSFAEIEESKFEEYKNSCE